MIALTFFDRTKELISYNAIIEWIRAAAISLGQMPSRDRPRLETGRQKIQLDRIKRNRTSSTASYNFRSVDRDWHGLLDANAITREGFCSCKISSRNWLAFSSIDRFQSDATLPFRIVHRWTIYPLSNVLLYACHYISRPWYTLKTSFNNVRARLVKF